jgi:hypothetical protein
MCHETTITQPADSAARLIIGGEGGPQTRPTVIKVEGHMRTANSEPDANDRVSGIGPAEHSRPSVGSEQSFREDGPLTGKPDAGDPPVRFGGRGG